MTQRETIAKQMEQLEMAIGQNQGLAAQAKVTGCLPLCVCVCVCVCVRVCVYVHVHACMFVFRHTRAFCCVQSH